MNRRQFLGRFFQAIISAHNSNSTYGIYHPWRQYDAFSTTLYINLKYKSSDSHTSYIPSKSESQTVIAVYDSNGIMIYCTAYYSGTTLVNYCDSTLYLNNMLPGTYTIKCLCYGIGLCEGENGNEMTITIPDTPDRSMLPNNNYGWMSAPTVTVDYLFGISGLYFKAESELENIGGYFYENQKLNAWRIECRAPSYEMCEAIYNEGAIAAGSSSRYDRYRYMQDMTRANPPITDEYRYILGDKYYVHSKIKAIFIDTDGEHEITSIDLQDYINEGASKAAEYWKVCDYNNLEYDPNTYYEEYSKYSYISWDIQISGITSTDGSYEAYTCMNGDYGILNPHKDCNCISMGGYGVYNGLSSARTEFNYQINNVYTELTSTNPQISIDGKKYYGGSMLWLNIRTAMSTDRWMNGNSNFYKEIVERGTGWKGTPQEQYESNLPTVSNIRNTFYNDYWLAAFDHYHTDPGKNIPWIKPDAKGYTYKYPVSALFGKLTADKSMYPVIPPPTSGDIPEPIYDGRLYWGVDAYSRNQDEYNAQRREMRPMLDGYTADLSKYDPNDQCNNSYMWTSINGHQAFLRQSTVPVDMESIPNHQIKP